MAATETGRPVAGESDPAGELLRLHRSGELAAQYPRVRHLLATATPGELARAGLLLSRLPADAVTRAHPQVHAVTVALTGNGTVTTMLPLLTAEFARHGLLLRARVGAFGGYVADLAGQESTLQATDADLVLCLLDPVMVFDELPAVWRPDDVGTVLARKLELLGRLVLDFEARGGGMLVLNTLPLPRRYACQLVDYRSRARLGALWREANAGLLALAGRHRSVIVVDLDPLLAEGCAGSDARQSIYARVHLSPQLLAAYAREVGHLARALTGRTRKCLALDLDGTLWGGVLGEDGVDGIEVADGYRGSAFRCFQRMIKQIGSQGVLLAAVSKNDAGQVAAALSGHGQMVLREPDFVRVIANWQPKHDNLAGLSETLNLGLDSLVFADDSPYECGAVRRELPDVAVIQLDDEPALHIDKLLRDGWFDVIELTAEDGSRAARYREELDRKDFLQSFDSLAEYLRELGIQVRLSIAGEADIGRVSQLTLRTNQFNLTTRRLQPAELRTLLSEPASLVLSIRATDRFGDNGLVGAVFARQADRVLHIDNFVLSCRVFSRGIEAACLSAVLRHARAAGLRAVVARYHPSRKNSVVKDFYPRYGFTPVAVADGGAMTFRHDLTDIIAVPEHLSLIDCLESGGP